MAFEKIKNIFGVATSPSVRFGNRVAYNLYNGDSLGTSVAKASVKGMFAASNPWLYRGLSGAYYAQKGYWKLLEFNHQSEQWWKAQYATSNVVGGNFLDTRGAQTMRQAAVQAIQGSKMNARSALGGEAKILSPY
ncbi:TPA: hypothetical protein QCS32_002196 [Bacillus thuringiensis]|uniref:Uncharacterized protein n=2 Tax=Bacillus cereus group TaxID=86661 RepID=A0AB34D5X5_BACCE|nr:MULTISPECIES: hypothetical protein [Bacillus cereus group]HDR5350561.1 hypothetical protein [Bacillus thuringiensis]KAB2497555.1 hypothetical protein F8158_13610 [Bacillus cereus]MCH5456706.1 hypothetical protein [Bacillus cereus]MCU5644078.1 hypothetical protein [Bacillus cereus]MDA1971522.1 hypothetical protein [Bacillus cereus]